MDNSVCRIMGVSWDGEARRMKSREIMQQSVASDCAPSASHHLSENEPGAVSDDTSPPASSSGEEAPDVDLSSVLERNWDAPAEDLDVLYKPSVTVQSIGVKMCSPSMTSETTHEFAGALSKVMGSADPDDLGTLPEPTVHCNRVSIEDCVQHIFRFFVLRSSRRGPTVECSSTDGAPPPKTPEAVPCSDSASTSMPAADLPATSREGQGHIW